MYYPPDIDDGCVLLCTAINSIPCLHTYESCCGHGIEPFHIWFLCHNLGYLHHLLDFIAKSGKPGWKCEATLTSTGALAFMLSHHAMEDFADVGELAGFIICEAEDHL